MSAGIVTPVFTIVDGHSPLICTAIHAGHEVRESLLPHFALEEAGRYREEDPYTGEWARLGESWIIGHRSRFEVDLNRPPDKAVYRVPEDAWGLEVWKDELPEEEYRQSMQQYHDFYRHVRTLLDQTVAEFGQVVVYDIHSYNHRRGGPDAAPDDPAKNPEVNIGTGTMPDRARCAPVVDRFIQTLRDYDFQGRRLDVRENVKFKGGYFAQWIHEHYPDQVCVLSIEFKKIFMDEWTGEPNWTVINALKGALRATMDRD